jgi:hypothetical protein
LAFGVEYAEDRLIHAHYNVISELVMPRVIF